MTHSIINQLYAEESVVHLSVKHPQRTKIMIALLISISSLSFNFINFLTKLLKLDI